MENEQNPFSLTIVPTNKENIPYKGVFAGISKSLIQQIEYTFFDKTTGLLVVEKLLADDEITNEQAENLNAQIRASKLLDTLPPELAGTVVKRVHVTQNGH